MRDWEERRVGSGGESVCEGKGTRAELRMATLGESGGKE